MSASWKEPIKRKNEDKMENKGHRNKWRQELATWNKQEYKKARITMSTYMDNKRKRRWISWKDLVTWLRLFVNNREKSKVKVGY